MNKLTWLHSFIAFSAKSSSQTREHNLATSASSPASSMLHVFKESWRGTTRFPSPAVYNVGAYEKLWNDLRVLNKSTHYKQKSEILSTLELHMNMTYLWILVLLLALWIESEFHSDSQHCHQMSTCHVQPGQMSFPDRPWYMFYSMMYWNTTALFYN